MKKRINNSTSESCSTHPEPGSFYPLGLKSNIDTIKQSAMPTPCPTIISTSLFHSIPLSQLTSSSHMSHLFFSLKPHPFRSDHPPTPPPGLNHFSISTTLLSAVSPLRPIPWPASSPPGHLSASLLHILRHLLYHQTEVKSSPSRISQV